MIGVPGSKAYFESIKIPGIETITAHGEPGCAHISLTIDKKENAECAECLRKQYIAACTHDLPIGMEVVVTIDGSSQLCH